MTTYICDRCNKKIEDLRKGRPIKSVMKTIRYGIYDNMELCPDCFEEFLIWIDMGKPFATQNSPKMCD